MTPTMFSMAPQPPPPWKKVLVTAGASFLGSHLCEHLLDAGVDVDCVDDLPTGSSRNVAHLTDRPGFRFLSPDLTGADLTEALPGPYDLVLHSACPAADALAHPLETLDAASLGTRNALAVAERDGARFLLASTCVLHGDPPGDSQRFAEALTTAFVSATEADAGIVRVFPVYGPRMGPADGRMIPALIRQALSGGPVTVPGDGSGRPSLCYVDDTVDGVLLVAASRSVRPVDIGGDPGPTVAEIARRVLDLTGSDARLEYTGTSAGNTENPEPPAPATGFAHELFGWTPKVPLEEGLRRTVADFVGRESDSRSAPGAEGGVRHACSW
ncbi:NAD-dependent epimerase/dehydratase family protein [Streptomyces sp. NPDC058284]|uniref:NAD-dependent epimerase/dehydratase family protein n=1 Tax=unclassified Streptomyces TaxID=2593676 RepID=UPI003655E006